MKTSSKKNKVLWDLNNTLNKRANYTSQRSPLLVTPNPGQNIHQKYLDHSHSENYNTLNSTIATQLKNLQSHEAYYMSLMGFQIQKYQQHYIDIYSIVDEEYRRGVNYLRQCSLQVLQSFERKKRDMKARMMQMPSNRRRGKAEKYEQVLQNDSLSVQLVEVHLPHIDQFREYFKRSSPFHVFYKQDGLEIDSKEQAPKQYQESGTQTDLLPELSEPEAPTRDEIDDLLSCDEQLGSEKGVRLSASALRRRKYEVGRRDIIREQDQFSESSSILSES